MTSPDEQPRCAACGEVYTAQPLRRGRCQRCYQRHTAELKKAGAFVPRLGTRSTLERLLDKAVAGPGGCLVWTGSRSDRGYGEFSGEGFRTQKAHRVAYELMVGPIPEGLDLDHTCHTRDASCQGGITCPHRRCINPHHLEPVTNHENSLRSPHTLPGSNVRKTHCPQGHPYNEANTYLRSNGNRMCRTCVLAQQRARRQRRKGEL